MIDIAKITEVNDATKILDATDATKIIDTTTKLTDWFYLKLTTTPFERSNQFDEENVGPTRKYDQDPHSSSLAWQLLWMWTPKTRGAIYNYSFEHKLIH